MILAFFGLYLIRLHHDQIKLVNALFNDTILNQLSESMVIVDPDGKILFFNDGAVKLQHLARRPFQKGVALTEIVSVERKDVVHMILNQVRTEKAIQTSEAEYKDNAGRSYFFEITFNPILGEDNEPEGVCIVTHDITHHKTFEKRSIQLINELSSLIENANALIFSVDSREYVTEWNKECIRVTHYEKNDVLAQKVNELIAEGSRENFDRLIKTVLHGEAMANQELIIKTKDDGSLTVLVNATPKVSQSKSVVGVLFVGQDITELSQYRHSLEEKVKDRTEKLKAALQKEQELVDLKNRFVSVASHEFKMPLSSIDSSLNFLKKITGLKKEDVQKLKNIETQVGFMKSMLEDVLTFKKGEENKLQANYQPIDLNSFLKRLMDEVSVGTHQTHTFKTEFQRGFQIESDEKLLRNIFLNLLGNAVKFSPGKNVVDVKVKQGEDHIEIIIRDFGIGINEGDMKRIFEPFNRGSNANEIKGTGLGLSIVKRAVETLGGTIDIKSELGEGTTIQVTLALKK